MSNERERAVSSSCCLRKMTATPNDGILITKKSSKVDHNCVCEKASSANRYCRCRRRGSCRRCWCCRLYASNLVVVVVVDIVASDAAASKVCCFDEVPLKLKSRRSNPTTAFKWLRASKRSPENFTVVVERNQNELGQRSNRCFSQTSKRSARFQL